MKHSSWKQIIPAAAVMLAARDAWAQAETPNPKRTMHASVYLNIPGEPVSFLGGGISPRDGKRQFSVPFYFGERVSITGLRFSYDSGHNECGAWGWPEPGEGGVARVSWVDATIPAQLKLGVGAVHGPGSSGHFAAAVPFQQGPVAGYSVALPKPVVPELESGAPLPAVFALAAEAEMTWHQPAVPDGAVVAEPRFWGSWPTVTIDFIPESAVDHDQSWYRIHEGTRNGGFQSGNTDWWSTQSFSGSEVDAIPRPGGASDDYAARLSGAAPSFISQYTYATGDDGNPIDKGVVSFDCSFQGTTGVLRVLLDNQVLGTLRASSALAGVWRHYYLDIPTALNLPDIPLTFHYEDPVGGQDLLLDNIGYSALEVWQNPGDPRDGGSSNYIYADNLTIEHGNGAILWGTSNDNGNDVANRFVTIAGDLTIDEFSWARTQTRGGPGDCATTNFILGKLINHGLLSLGTAGNDLGMSANLGSDLTVAGAFQSDSRIEVFSKTLTVDGNATGSLAGTVMLAGGTFRTINGGALASAGVGVSGTGIYDITYTDGTAVRLEGAIGYLLDNSTQKLSPNGGTVTWSGVSLTGGITQLTGGLTALIGAAGINNAGQIQLQDANTKLTLPDDSNTVNWREFFIDGNGTLSAATGTTIELIAGSNGVADQHARIANSVVLANGATLKTRRPTSGSTVDAGTSLITGGLVNHGALVLGDDSNAGSNLTVSGAFQSNGTINTKDGFLTVHEVPTAALGNSLALSGGGLRATGTTVFAVDSLSITGQGTVAAQLNCTGTVTRTNFTQTGGSLLVNGGQLNWSGEIAVGASLGVAGGAVALISDATVVTNNGGLTASSGAVLHGPAYIPNIMSWSERRIDGTGSIIIGGGGVLDLDPAYYSNVFGWRAGCPITVENNVSIASGGEMLVRQAHVEDYYYPGTATLAGSLTNSGTINLGTETIVGSHLSIRGQFHNTGTVNLHGCNLSLDGNASGTVGGRVNLYGGSFVTSGEARITADDLTIRGSGNVNLNVASGKVNFLGADTLFSLSGAVPSGLAYHLGEGAQLNLGTSFSNNGQVEVATGSVFKAPWVGWGGWWNENTLAGNGTITIGTGGRMEMAAAEFHYWDWHQYMWLAVDNSITIASGGELRNIQGVVQDNYFPGTNIIRGPLVNQGTINLGTESVPGSHLRVTGSFANSGTINAYWRNLYISPADPDALAHFGGQVNLFGSYFGDEATPVSPGQNPVFRGTGTVALQLAGGQVTLRGTETSLAIHGGVGGLATLTIDGGASTQIDPYIYQNDGTIFVTGAGTTLRGSLQTGHGHRQITGSGVIRVADGARMEVESFSRWEWGWSYHSWNLIDNDLDIRPGGEFKTLCLSYSPGWTEVRGQLANAGTLNVAMPLRLANPLHNEGLIRLGSTLQISGSLTNSGVILFEGGNIDPSGGLEQTSTGEIQFSSADPYTILKTGGGRVIARPGQHLTFAAGSTLDGWELTANDSSTVARIPAAATGESCTLTGQWLTNPGPFGAALNLTGTDGRIIVLEMSYAGTNLNPLFEQSLYLRWRLPNGVPVAATVGNTGRGIHATERFLGSWEELTAAGHSLVELLGSYGIDTRNKRVWAVINPDSAAAAGSYALASELLSPAYQTWIANSGLTGQPGVEYDSTMDSDHDGRSNLQEFAFASNPLECDANRVIGAATALADRGPLYTLTLPVRSGAVFSGSGALRSSLVDGLIYHIQGSADLADFASLGVSEVTGAEAITIQNNLPPLASGWTYRTFCISNPPAGRAFFRVGVETP